jgi:hypothetical protein
MTRSVAVAGERLRFVLPGTWVSVPVDDPARAAAFAKRFARRQIGAADRLARLRREAAQELVASAADAVRAGAHTYLMALELLPGVPFGAAVLARDVDWPEASRPHVAAGEVAQALEVGFPGGEVAEQRLGPASREAETSHRSLGEGTQVTVLRLTYRVPYPDRSRLLEVLVNAPELPSAEPFAMLFDEIVDSVTFEEAAATPVGAPAAP